MSEKLSDAFNPLIKYGGGDAATQQELATFSDVVASVETNERSIALLADGTIRRQFQSAIEQQKSEIAQFLRRLAADAERRGRMGT